MKTEDIVKTAEERLAKIEAEAVKLRAMIVAAKGPSVAPFISIPQPIELVVYNGVRPTLDGVVVGGPPRMDPNVHFADGASDGGYASFKSYLDNGGKWD